MKLDLRKVAERGVEILDRVIEAELIAGRPDPYWETRGTTCPVCGQGGGKLTGLLYLRTATGTCGTGAHAGFIRAVHLDCADWAECAESGSEPLQPLPAGEEGECECASCRTMLREVEAAAGCGLRARG